MFDTNSFYRVRVDLPPEFARDSRSSAPPAEVQVRAKILTQRENLLNKLFGSFRGLSRNL